VRAVLQRVIRGSVTVENEKIGSVGRGLVVLLGVGRDDSEDDADYMAEKVSNMRIFEDAGGKMNLSVRDIGGGVLAVSQFTLFGDCRKGRRPNFTEAAPAHNAELLYNRFCAKLESNGITVSTGRFQAMMTVEIINDGPVTILLDSKKQF